MVTRRLVRFRSWTGDSSTLVFFLFFSFDGNAKGDLNSSCLFLQVFLLFVNLNGLFFTFNF